jgi:hypothetical protein
MIDNNADTVDQKRFSLPAIVIVDSEAAQL